MKRYTSYCAARALLAIFILSAFMALHTRPSFAQDSTPDSVDQYFTQARLYLNDNKPREAITLLKEGIRRYPDSGELARLLARAYFDDGNEFWALKVLNEHAAKSGDCETLTWIAWQHLKTVRVELAEAVLNSGSAQKCATGTPVAVRWNLLQAMLSDFQSNPKAAAKLVQTARKNRKMFPEDSELLRYMENLSDPGWIQPVHLRVEQAVGWDSNALLASVSEAKETDQEIDSWLVSNRHELRFVMPLSALIRPDLEYRGRWKEYFEEDAKDFSLYDMNYRAGILLGYYLPRVGLYYAGQNLLYNGPDQYDDGPRWFYEAHRGEMDIDILRWLYVFGGAGRRTFRERARSRDEYDAGAALHFRFPRGHSSFSAIGSGRTYDAQIDAYNEYGGTVLGSLHVPYYRDGYLRLGASWSFDEYPDSEDYFEIGEKRSDEMLRYFPSAWSPSYYFFRAGITYQYTDRGSTIEAYNYDVHEFLFKVVFNWNDNPWTPAKANVHNHVNLDYGLTRAAHDEERMKDLLRQEDAAQRSSSCVD